MWLTSSRGKKYANKYLEYSVDRNSFKMLSGEAQGKKLSLLEGLEQGFTEDGTFLLDLDEWKAQKF